MIDCTKTKNYFAEKARMTKKDKLGRCKLYCGECLLNNKNNGTSENLLCGAFEALVICKNCSASVIGVSRINFATHKFEENGYNLAKEQAIKAWNRRGDNGK